MCCGAVNGATEVIGTGLGTVRGLLGGAAGDGEAGEIEVEMFNAGDRRDLSCWTCCRLWTGEVVAGELRCSRVRLAGVLGPGLLLLDSGWTADDAAGGGADVATFSENAPLRVSGACLFFFLLWSTTIHNASSSLIVFRRGEFILLQLSAVL